MWGEAQRARGAVRSRSIPGYQRTDGITPPASGAAAAAPGDAARVMLRDKLRAPSSCPPRLKPAPPPKALAGLGEKTERIGWNGVMGSKHLQTASLEAKSTFITPLRGKQYSATVLHTAPADQPHSREGNELQGIPC